MTDLEAFDLFWNSDERGDAYERAKLFYLAGITYARSVTEQAHGRPAGVGEEP